MQYADGRHSERRESVKEDAKEVAILCDALPNIDFVYGLVGIMDCPAIISEIYELSNMLRYTTKPLAGWNNSLEGCQETLDMCVAVAGSLERLQEKPFIFMYAGNPVAPFVHPKEYLEKLKFWVEHKIPVIYPTGTQLGINGPVTMAGALVSAMVDDLAAHFADAGITKVVGAEARGFIVGAAVSHNFGLASSGTGIGTGPVAIAVVVGFVVLGVISVMNMQKLEG